MKHKVIPEYLNRARLLLEDIEGYNLKSDWVQFPDSPLWCFEFSLTQDLSIEDLGGTTNWFVKIDQKYPRGTIKIYPSVRGGIKSTYPHQDYNTDYSPKLPFRSGGLCLDEPLKVVGRDESITEPINSKDDRLKWHIERAKEWIKLASQAMLVSDGDPYEIPPLPCIKESVSAFTLVFSEDNKSLKNWDDVAKKRGVFSFYPLNSNKVFLISNYFFADGVKHHKSWGTYVEKNRVDNELGLWIIMKDVPVLYDQHLPNTWAELRKVFTHQGLSLDDFLRERVDRIRETLPHILAIGFPIPEIKGQPATQIHWFCIELPRLCNMHDTAKGFRNNALGRWIKDLQSFKSDIPLKWVSTENWSKSQILTRGAYDSKLREKSVLIIGAGSLGTCVAEQLTKLGVEQICIVDDDILKSGNLVRHPLGMNYLGVYKANGVATHLGTLMPYVKPVYFKEEFHGEFAQGYDLIIDCTGSDDALIEIERQDWEGKEKTQLISFSFGIKLGRLFVYQSNELASFTFKKFRALYTPWEAKESKDYPGFKLPKEGVGCWHPAFPGRFDDVTMWASICSKYIEESIDDSSTFENFTTYTKQTDKLGKFSGITKESL